MASARRFQQAGIATPHHLASAAGLDVLAAGGNAIDAAVAANLTLGVVTPYLCGFGGDLFAIVWDGELHGYLGSGRSGTAASIDALRSGAPSEHMPHFGPHSATVPGAVDGWFALLDRWGTRSFGELAAAARRYALDGFTVSAPAGEMITGCRGFYTESPEWMTAYGAIEAGATLRQPALARTIDVLAADGRDAYYGDPIGSAIAVALEKQGGFHRVDDIAGHAGEWATPMRAGYRGVEIAELPPPTQGVTALEALRILDGFDLSVPGPAREHMMIEAVKLALADRDTFVTDPDHMPVAAERLVSEEWIADRRKCLDPDIAMIPEPGLPHVGGTAYLCAADADGLLVSLIQSNFLGFGSGVHVPEWGINLNNRGSSFSLDPQRVNAFGSSKRPMHTLVPAMALRDAAPWLVFGSMGGDAQIQVHVQLLTDIIDDGADAQDAIDAPRWRVDPGTWLLHAEPGLGAETIAALEARGHRVRTSPPLDSGMGHAHAIELIDSGGYAVASDPRSEGAALGL